MSMRHGWALGMILAAAIVGAATSGQAQDRRLNIAFVNMEQVFSEYHKTRLADGQLRAQAEEFNRERQEMVDELQAAQAALKQAREDAQDVALSAQARDRRSAEAEEHLVEIREMEDRLRRFDELRSKQLEDQGRRMRRGLVKEILEAVQEYARANAIDAVIDSSGQSLSGIETVLYVDARAEVTEAIITRLNRDAPGE